VLSVNSEVILIYILFEIHYALNQNITFAFHWVETFLHQEQTLTNICYDTFLTILLKQNHANTFKRPINIKNESLIEIWHV
jgi:hypothetical protein